MDGTLDDRYFEWLYGIVASVRNRNPSRSYWNLSKQLYGKEFIWLVPNDDNRVEDGKDLRFEFIEEMGFDEVNQDWLHLGCSVLEMMIALARRVSFEADWKTPVEWYGTFLENLGLNNFTDARYSDEVAQRVDEILDALVYRTYEHNGEGGLFPLSNPAEDQRHVELWYQMSAYLLEIGPI